MYWGQNKSRKKLRLLPQARRQFVSMVLCHVVVEDIPGFHHLEAQGALISFAELMLCFEMSFHVISFVGTVGFGRMAEGADKVPIVRTDSMPLHQVCMATR